MPVAWDVTYVAVLVAVFADAHAHAEALDAVIAAADASGTEALWSLGDMVGAGPDPHHVVARTRERCTVALSMAFGPAEGLALLDALAAGGSLDGYHRLAAVRGDLLARLGRVDEARVELARAAEQTENAQERSLLVARIASL